MNSNDSNTKRGKRRFLWAALVFPLLTLLAGTLYLRFSSVDLQVSQIFFDDKGEWYLKDFPLFVFLYKWGVQPALIIAAIAMLVIIGGFFSAGLRRWRKITGYFLLVLIVGPGIIVNAVLKEHWGRPRPREVVEFGGSHQFERVWQYDARSGGKSFPSGHASMGFCLLGLYFVARALRQRRATLAALCALGLGLLLGLARIAQGAHFVSDVLWSAGICYFVALGLYCAMRLQERPFYVGDKPSGRVGLCVALAVIGSTLPVVALPHESRGVIAGNGDVLRRWRSCRVDVDLYCADLRTHEVGFLDSLGGFTQRLEENIYRVYLNGSFRGFCATKEQSLLTLPPGKTTSGAEIL
ncbi:MAG: phosphatase PAP2 family protein [Verrucomicrobiales bacterium]